MQLPLPPITRYDQAARYLLLRAGPLLFTWLLRRTAEQVRFQRWLPTQLTLPGVAERLCDAVAELVDLEGGGRPVAALLEVQTTPDANMAGRLLLAGGLLWLTVKPTALPGDRYDLLAVVLNLTGNGNSAQHCVLSMPEWTLRPIEINFAAIDAGEVLDQIEANVALRELLAFIPLMQRGDEDAIIHRWRQIVVAETDLRQGADYALATIFAERVGRRDVWQTAVEGFSMIESPIIAELLADAAGKAEARARAESLLRVLRKRHQNVPEELAMAIRACTNSDQLDRWLDAAVEAQTMEQFRQQTGL